MISGSKIGILSLTFSRAVFYYILCPKSFIVPRMIRLKMYIYTTNVAEVDGEWFWKTSEFIMQFIRSSNLVELENENEFSLNLKFLTKCPEIL